MDRDLLRQHIARVGKRMVASNSTYPRGKIADILFHVIGHHIHFTCRPEYREREDVADIWLVRLGNNYNRQRFRWVTKFVRFIRFLLRPFFDRQRGKLMLWMLQKGSISHAEYKERVGKSKPGKAMRK